MIVAAAIYFLVIVPINAMKNRHGPTPEDEKSNEDKMVELLERIADNQTPSA